MPKPKPYWYQFCLLRLVVFVTVFLLACFWFGVKMQQAKVQREAVAAIREAGGRVKYRKRDQMVTHKLSKVLGEDFVWNVEGVYFSATAGDEDLEDLKELTNLRSLRLSGTQVTDTGLDRLQGLTSLRSLYLRDTRVTDEGVKKLRQALRKCKITTDQSR